MWFHILGVVWYAVKPLTVDTSAIETRLEYGHFLVSRIRNSVTIRELRTWATMVSTVKEFHCSGMCGRLDGRGIIHKIMLIIGGRRIAGDQW